MVGNTVAFRVHAPCSANLLLDIFANAVTPQVEKYGLHIALDCIDCVVGILDG